MLTRKSELLRLRLEPELYLRVKALALASHVSVSRFVRDAVEIECIRRSPVQKDIVNEAPRVIHGDKKSPKKSKAKVITGRYGVQASSLLANLLTQSKHG